MKQSSLGLGTSTKRTRRREFLDEMDRVVPWSDLVAQIAPFMPEGKRGRPPFPVESLLRIHFMQQWFTLSDPAMEDALHDMPLFRDFAGLGGWDDRLPDESTILRFPHVLEKHKLAERILATVNLLLGAKGLMLRSGTVVDATLISAPSSTKNASGERDPEMHQSKKGQQWFFGMKAHIGVDADSGLVHTVRGTSGNVNDVVEANSLLHGQETDAFADAGYQGAHKRPDAKEDVQWHVAMRPGLRKLLDKADPADALTEQVERIKASIRAKVEHPFRVIKRQFGHVKVRYRGLAKNTAQLHTLFALANLWMVRKRLTGSLA
ncbi:MULTISPECIES: IS5-like element ISBmu20 family transposase [Burkholderia]|uniref:ISBmu20 transposase n=1 Tax=Burkholderia multivorans (strain ATCC 17616 / 249) TaxID=395019 RepID=A0A0H3KQP9_BURM1|nr:MULTISPECIES: IS5-like element ISBmu20 family transposase [Burkholderia]ABX19316.1 transposase IS4 family protein [Burkholderia multivorans ATCC 17616]AIO71649.1 transposase DDE domain protein [Burkholderia multivorans]KVS32124.1 transposase [Burkholderia vietnamiensis]MBR7914145.1 IS5-like element ISBmu20 family transposase [Burkholderia vietnamiensis]MBR8003833.1 IS5-like element ISBmu20 family transposase [Burkholderia vietnamiensis]